MPNSGYLFAGLYLVFVRTYIGKRKSLNGIFMSMRWNGFLFGILGIFLWGIPLNVSAQDARVDSLLDLIKIAKEDSIRIRHYLEISSHLQYEKPATAREFLQIAKKLSEKSRYTPQEVQLFLRLGQLEGQFGQHEGALTYLKKAIHLAQEFRDTLSMGIGHYRLAQVYIMRDQLAKAMETLIESEKCFRELDSLSWLADVRSSMGQIYYKQSYFHAAKQHLEAAILLHQQNNNAHGIARSQQNLGVICKNEKEYEEAVSYYKKALIYFEEKKLLKEQVYILNNLGSLELQRERPQAALSFLEDALVLGKGLEANSIKSMVLVNMGEAFHKLGKFSQAIPFFEQAFAMADSLKLDQLKLIISQGMATTFDSLDKDASALIWLKKAFVLQDSITQRKQIDELGRLQQNYEMQQQAEENIRLKKEKELQQFRNITITLGLVFVSLIALVLFFEYRKKNRLNGLLASHQASIHQQNEQLQIQNDRLEALDKEKNMMMGMLAHDIRDPLAQIEGLSGILLDQNQLSKQQNNFVRLIKNTARTLTQMSQRLLDLEALNEGKLSLHLEALNFGEIVDESIAAYASKSQQKNILLKRCKYEPECWVKADAQAVRQVLDNLISNALKFSPSHTEVNICLEVKEKAIRLIVSDQGPGIPEEEMPLLFQKFHVLSNQPTAGEKSTGLGLALVKKYVEAMDGQIRCESQPGKGSTFLVSLPKASTIFV